MSRHDARAVHCALMLVVIVLAIMLVAACAARPAVWEHFTGERWPEADDPCDPACGA